MCIFSYEIETEPTSTRGVADELLSVSTVVLHTRVRIIFYVVVAGRMSCACTYSTRRGIYIIRRSE